MVCSKMDELANLIVSYSLAVTPGEKVLKLFWKRAVFPFWTDKMPLCSERF